MDQCQRCFSWNIGSECRCKEFNVVDENGETISVWASGNEYDAALKYAEDSNVENDYYLMDCPVDILVNGKAFRISAEPDVHYSANEL